MRALFCRPLILSGIVISLSFFHPSVTHAGMLGDLWGSIVGFFTGNKRMIQPWKHKLLRYLSKRIKVKIA